MIKKFLILLLILLNLNLIFSAYEYNSTYQNLTLDPNGWCTNLPIDFTIYTQQDWDNKEKIEDDLCGVNETPDEDRCLEFESLEDFPVKIFSGPFDSMPVLLDTKTNSENKFSQTFTNPGKYLIEIRPDGEYNDYYTHYEVLDCKYSNPEVINYTPPEEKPSQYNLSINKLNLKFNFKNLNTNKTDSIQITNINPQIKLKNNTIKSFEFTLKDNQTTFDSLDVILENINFDKNSKIQLFKYDNSTQTWQPQSDIKIENNNIILKSLDKGIYSVTEEKPQTEVIKTIEELPQNSNQNLPPQINQEPTKSPTDNFSFTESKASPTSIIFLIILGILIFGVIGYFLLHNSFSKDKPATDKMPQNSFENTHQPTQNPESVEHLNTYNQVYTHTKQYVQTYYPKYSKDQIYRALKQANIPSDIIDKVFSEIIG